MGELQAELGLERIVKLASNEGAFGPLPAAVAAFEAAVAQLNRYPDGGGVPLREALAERHGLAAGAGRAGQRRGRADPALRGRDARPRRRRAFPWPSFPSYGRRRAAAAPSRCRAAAGRRPTWTRCSRRRGGRARSWSTSPTRTTRPARCSTPREVRSFLDELPDGVLCVLDEAYAEYAEPEPEGPALLREGAPAAVRAAHVLEGLRARGAAGRATRSRRPTWPTRSTGCGRSSTSTSRPRRPRWPRSHEARRRGARGSGTPAGRASACSRRWPGPGSTPSRSQANFVYADVPGGDGAGLAGACSTRRGCSFASCPASARPPAIRVTVGTDEENEAFAAALGPGGH